jgi:hypothetical protein
VSVRFEDCFGVSEMTALGAKLPRIDTDEWPIVGFSLLPCV